MVLPIIEGSEGSVKSFEEAKSLCKEINYPILIKAAAGGGGKGMKIVNEESELEIFIIIDLNLKLKNILVMMKFLLKSILKIQDI